MTADEPTMAEEQFTALFAAGEEALVAGRAAEAEDSRGLPGDVRQRLNKDLACAHLLHQVLRQPVLRNPTAGQAPPVTIDLPPPPPPGRINVALLPEPGRPQLVGEIQVSLRRRLLTIYFICAALIALVAILWLLFWIIEPSTGYRATEAVFAWSLAAIWTGLALILRSARRLSLSQLRVLELVGFGAMAFANGWWTYEGFQSGMLRRYAGLGGEAMIALANHVSIMWFALMMIYGMFIPNTWRRCAAVIGAIGLVPFAIGAATGFVDEALDRGLLTAFLLQLGWWMALGAAVAIYGSHKISLLRQEAFEARKFGQYQLKQRLGTGGMGEVYLAEHLLLKQPCAIKLIRPERVGDSAILRRFEREVQATARLKHWNTVQIYDYGHAVDGTFYYVMEYLPGPTLEQVVKRHGPLPPGRAVHLLRQACQALREAHGLRLVHRDIKPANIMLCERGGVHDVVKLLDFGLVKAVGLESQEEKLTQEGAVAGTPTYMSPEQASAKEQVDARSDIYSLGAVAYFLLTGQPPFRRDRAIQLIVAHIHEPVRPLTELRTDMPPDLQAVVLRCLEKDPARRFANVDALEEALAACSCAGQWTEALAAQWWPTCVSTGDDGAAPTRDA